MKDYFGTIHILRTFFQGGWGGEKIVIFAYFQYQIYVYEEEGGEGQKSLKIIFTQK